MKVFALGVFTNWGCGPTPKTPKSCNPDYGDPQKGTPDFGKPNKCMSERGSTTIQLWYLCRERFQVCFGENVEAQEDVYQDLQKKNKKRLNPKP